MLPKTNSVGSAINVSIGTLISTEVTDDQKAIAREKVKSAAKSEEEEKEFLAMLGLDDKETFECGHQKTKKNSTNRTKTEAGQFARQCRQCTEQKRNRELIENYPEVQHLVDSYSRGHLSSLAKTLRLPSSGEKLLIALRIVKARKETGLL